MTEIDVFQVWRCAAGCYWRLDPHDDRMQWWVVPSDDGWVWFSFMHTTSQRTSSLFGPFSSWQAAVADCESVHKECIP